MRRVAALLLVLSSVVTGCLHTDGEPPPARTEAAALAWTGPPKRSGDGSVEFGPFNRYVERSTGSWRRSPLELTARFLGLERQTAARTTVELVRPRLGLPRTIVTIDGLEDDSVRAVRYVLELTREPDGTWRIYKARWAQRCWPRRGHRDFSPELCV